MRTFFSWELKKVAENASFPQPVTKQSLTSWRKEIVNQGLPKNYIIMQILHIWRYSLIFLQVVDIYTLHRCPIDWEGRRGQCSLELCPQNLLKSREPATARIYLQIFLDNNSSFSVDCMRALGVLHCTGMMAQ